MLIRPLSVVSAQLQKTPEKCIFQMVSFGELFVYVHLLMLSFQIEKGVTFSGGMRLIQS